MTRGMFVTVLEKFAQADTEPYGEPAFQDVPAGAYYAPYVGWAAEKGVVNGVSAAEFAPGRDLTREQMATMLYNYAQEAGCDVSSNPEALRKFPDGGSVSAYAQEPMAWAVTHRVLAGSDGRLNPPGDRHQGPDRPDLLRRPERALRPGGGPRGGAARRGAPGGRAPGGRRTSRGGAAPGG